MHVFKSSSLCPYQEFDKKYNPTWHCIVGRNFGSYVTHETKHFIYFYLGQVAILLFKSGWRAGLTHYPLLTIKHRLTLQRGSSFLTWGPTVSGLLLMLFLFWKKKKKKWLFDGEWQQNETLVFIFVFYSWKCFNVTYFFPLLFFLIKAEWSGCPVEMASGLCSLMWWNLSKFCWRSYIG